MNKKKQKPFYKYPKKRWPLFNPFLFIKSKRIFISSEGFSALEKNAVICSQRAKKNCCLSSWVWHPLQIEMGGLAHVFYLFILFYLPDRVWQPAADNSGCLAHFRLLKKVCQTAITICRELSHPTRSLSRIVCRGQEGPKGSKGTLRPDFQANTPSLISMPPLSTLLFPSFWDLSSGIMQMNLTCVVDRHFSLMCAVKTWKKKKLR